MPQLGTRTLQDTLHDLGPTARCISLLEFPIIVWSMVSSGGPVDPTHAMRTFVTQCMGRRAALSQPCHVVTSCEGAFRGGRLFSVAVPEFLY